jgi:hypothetical protein
LWLIIFTRTRLHGVRHFVPQSIFLQSSLRNNFDAVDLGVFNIAGESDFQIAVLDFHGNGE